MNYNYRYRIDPDEPVEAELERHIDTCRQLYNHYLYELRNTDEYLSYTAMQNMLPDLKDWWDDLNDVYSKVSQMVARRVSDNLDRLKDQKDCGFETDRDENAAYNVLQRGLQELGVGTRRSDACGDCTPYVHDWWVVYRRGCKVRR